MKFSIPFKKPTGEHVGSGSTRVERVERLEHVPESQLRKIMKVYESQGARVKATPEKGDT